MHPGCPRFPKRPRWWSRRACVCDHLRGPGLPATQSGSIFDANHEQTDSKPARCVLADSGRQARRTSARVAVMVQSRSTPTAGSLAGTERDCPERCLLSQDVTQLIRRHGRGEASAIPWMVGAPAPRMNQAPTATVGSDGIVREIIR